MGCWRIWLLCGALSLSARAAHAQWEVETDPTAFALSGYSVHVADAIWGGRSRLQVGAFGAKTPEWVHGNSGWTEYSRGGAFKVDYFVRHPLRGVFVGLDSNFSRVRYTLQATNERAYQAVAGLGGRTGCRFTIGEHFYITPWMSVDYQFGAKDVSLSGKKFEQGKVAVFPAVHVGWRF